MFVETVLIWLVSATTLAMPPPLSTSTPLQATPPRMPTCKCDDDKVINPGEEHYVTDCVICKCNEAYQVSTEVIDCFFKECVDSVKTPGDKKCCPTCPKGPDCEAVYGPDPTDRKIIPAGKPFRFGNTICSCDDPEVDTGKVPRAVCFEEPTPPTTPYPTTTPTTTTYPKTTPYFTATPYTTTPKPECICEDGVKISPGQTHFINDCYTCECDSQYRVTMIVADCYYLACVDSFNKPNDGICCPKCPNGPNCEAFINGVRHIIPDNGTFYIGDINCTCQPLYYATFYGLTRKATCTVPLATSTLISTPTGPEPTG
ncbi:hypothetical protein SNE40_008719 [Patella caerulea]|uniref:VWFC domain-containing protein n=1 Tax=Patella caerulea TaxID=87958 RepID=A0AAN8JMQ8_PATCE